MKKKTILRIGIVAVLLILVIAYFWPLSLANAVDESGKINIVLTDFSIQNGEPDIDFTNYTDITPDQKQALLTLFEKYTYRRTLLTPFSDGSMDDLSDHQLLSIYVFHDISDTDYLVIGSKEIAINSKNFRIKNADQLIAEIIKIVE